MVLPFENTQSSPVCPADKFFRIGLIAITSRCNLNCIMCFEKNESSNYREIDLEEFKKLVDSLKDRGVAKIVFIGGECTLLRNIDKYIKYISDSGIQPHFTTNGTTLANTNRLKELLDSGLRGVEFSVHSHIQKDSSLISGRSNTHKLQLKALENFAALSPLYNPPPQVHINTVITNINLPYLEELVAFYVNNYGINSFSLKAPSIEGNMRLNKELVPDFSRSRPALEKIAEFSKTAGAKMILDGFPLCMIPQRLIPMTIPFIDSGSILEGWNYRPRIHRRRFDFTPPGKIHGECARCVFAPICQGFNSSYISIFPDASPVPMESFLKLEDDVALPLAECLRLTSVKNIYDAGSLPGNIDSHDAICQWASDHVNKALINGAVKIRFHLDRGFAGAHVSLPVILNSAAEAGLQPVIAAYGHLFNSENLPPSLSGFKGIASFELIFHSASELERPMLSGEAGFKEDCRRMLILLKMKIPVSINVPVTGENANGLIGLVKLAGLSKVNKISFELPQSSAGQSRLFKERIREAVEFSLSEYPELRVELKGFPYDILPDRGYLFNPPINS